MTTTSCRITTDTEHIGYRHGRGITSHFPRCGKGNVRTGAYALREDWLNRLTGKPADLLPFEAVAAVLRSYQHRQLTEVRTIPLDKIVGSVGRYKDFNRRFLPRQRSLAYRWARVEQAMDSSLGVPPIEVYQIGEVYFVLDGNHRVSVARANGFDTIDAYVTIVPVAADIEAGDSLDEAINKAECAHFLAQTRLAEHCKELDIEFTKPGGYPKLLEHIYTHRYFMGLDAPEEGPRISFPAAAADWYANVYLPIVASIRQHDLVRRFPGQTPADLYVQVSARILEQSTQQGARARRRCSGSGNRGACSIALRGCHAEPRATAGGPCPVCPQGPPACK